MALKVVPRKTPDYFIKQPKSEILATLPGAHHVLLGPSKSCKSVLWQSMILDGYSPGLGPERVRSPTFGQQQAKHITSTVKNPSSIQCSCTRISNRASTVARTTVSVQESQTDLQRLLEQLFLV